MPKLLGDVLKISARANAPNAPPPGCAPDVAIFLIKQTGSFCVKKAPLLFHPF